MITAILVRGKIEVAKTDKPIPLKKDRSVDYEKYVDYIMNGREEKKADRDLTKIF